MSATSEDASQTILDYITTAGLTPEQLGELIEHTKAVIGTEPVLSATPSHCHLYFSLTEERPHVSLSDPSGEQNAQSSCGLMDSGKAFDVGCGKHPDSLSNDLCPPEAFDSRYEPQADFYASLHAEYSLRVLSRSFFTDHPAQGTSEEYEKESLLDPAGVRSSIGNLVRTGEEITSLTMPFTNVTSGETGSRQEQEGASSYIDIGKDTDSINVQLLNDLLEPTSSDCS